MIRHVFDTVGAWGGLRFGLWVGAAAAAAIWATFFYTPVLHIGPELPAPASDFEVITAAVTVAGLLAAFGLGVVAGHARMLRQRRTIRSLRADLAAERAVSAHLAAPTTALLADVYGADPLEDPRG